MNIGDIKFYRERWRQINALSQFAIEQRIERKDDDGEMDVFRQWAKLKEKYESGKWDRKS